MRTARAFSKYTAANSTSADFTAPVDTFVPPSGGIDLTVSGGTGEVPCELVVIPYGLGNDNDTFSLRLIGWTRIRPQIADGRWQFVPNILAEFACTLSQEVGLSGGVVLNTERYCDTITIVTEATKTADVTRMGSVFVTAPGADLKAHLRMKIQGVEYITADFDQTGGTTPSMNFLYRLLD